MTTTTERTTKPTKYGLYIETHFPLDPAAGPALDAYDEACVAWEDAEGELQADWQQLTADGLDMTLRDFCERRDELAGHKASLEEQLTRLLWRRVEVLPKLLPSAQAHLEKTKVDYEKSIQDDMQRLRDTGAADGLAGMAITPVIGERQLRHRVEAEEWNLAMRGQVARAQSYVNAVKGPIGVPVTASRCRINLPIPDGTHDAVRRLLA